MAWIPFLAGFVVSLVVYPLGVAAGRWHREWAAERAYRAWLRTPEGRVFDAENDLIMANLPWKDASGLPPVTFRRDFEDTQ